MLRQQGIDCDNLGVVKDVRRGRQSELCFLLPTRALFLDSKRLLRNKIPALTMNRECANPVAWVRESGIVSFTE